LLAIHKLQAFEPSAAGVQRLLLAAERNRADAAIAALSSENRFDAAYKAIMQCAMIGLWANGYRPSTSQPGHHQTALQTLPKTLGVDHDVVIVLDALRKQRNLSDYEGDPVSEGAVVECCQQAAFLLDHTRTWLGKNRPDLLVVQEPACPKTSSNRKPSAGSLTLATPASTARTSPRTALTRNAPTTGR
jgi:hypothetical protein